MEANTYKNDAFKVFLFFVIVFLLAALNGCATSSHTVAPQNRIAVVPDQPQKGTWESKNVALEYEFVKEGGVLGLFIDGRTKRRMDQVALWVLFLDSEGRLIERESVFNSGFRTQRTRARRMQGTIERAFEVPKGTKYLAFQTQEKPYSGHRHR